MRFAWLVLLLASSSPLSSARAQDPAKQPVETRVPTAKHAAAVSENASHPSLGTALGRHGEGLVIGVRYDQPLGERGIFARPNFYTNFGPFYGSFDPVLQFGLDLGLRSGPYFGLFRVYGAGSFFLGYRPRPVCKNPVDASDRRLLTAEWGTELQGAALTDKVNQELAVLDQRCEDQKQNLTLGGGGYSGIEFFVGQHRAFYIEIGGTSGAQKSTIWRDSGLLLHVGSQFYF